LTLYAANGQYRSGSTLAYNLLKDIVKERIIGGRSGKEANELMASAQDHIIKVHIWSHPGAFCVYTYRHPVDRMISGLTINAWTADDIPARYAKALAMVKIDSDIFLKQHSSCRYSHVLFLKYEDFVGNVHGMAREIADFTKFPADCETIAAKYSIEAVTVLMNRLKSRRSERCMETEFRPNHIAKKLITLPGEVIHQCLDENKEFLREAGYDN